MGGTLKHTFKEQEACQKMKDQISKYNNYKDAKESALYEDYEAEVKVIKGSSAKNKTETKQKSSKTK